MSPLPNIPNICLGSQCFRPQLCDSTSVIHQISLLLSLRLFCLSHTGYSVALAHSLDTSPTLCSHCGSVRCHNNRLGEAPSLSPLLLNVPNFPSYSWNLILIHTFLTSLLSFLGSPAVRESTPQGWLDD